MILGAGFGSRMDPLTQERPKPFLPVGDRPLLAQVAEVLRGQGEFHATINTHWMKEYISNNISHLSVSFNLSPEVELLGVAGGIAAARPQLDAPVAVWNGDIWIRTPPLEALRAAAQSNGAICLAVAPTEGEGTVGLDAQRRVVRLRGEQFGPEVCSADYMGMCGLSECALSEMPERGCLIGDYCVPRLRAGLSVQTLRVDEPWFDIGSRSGYLAANLAWLNDRDAVCDSFVHGTAKVAAEVELRQSIVGAKAVVSGQGALHQCIVWPGARAQAPLSRCIVTPERVVPIDATAPFSANAN